MVETYYPIFIPMKGHSLRCPNKNKVLLPFMTRVFKTFNTNIIPRCIIVTESDEIISLAKELGYKNIYKEETINGKSVNPSEYHAILKCIEAYNNHKIKFRTKFDMSYFFLAPVTQPFKSNMFYDYIMDLKRSNKLNSKMSNTSFITTICSQQDRKIFEYNIKDNKFEVESNGRKGAMCDDKYYIDGYWYFVKTQFVSDTIWSLENYNNILKDKDFNEIFWSSNFEVVKNDNYLFCDIDSVQDIYKLLNTINLIRKIY